MQTESSHNMDKRAGLRQVALAFPILPGKEKELRSLAERLTTTMCAEYEASQKRLKIHRETWFFQPNQKGGGLTIVFAEGDDPVESLHQVMRSDGKFETWLRSRFYDLTGIDLRNQPLGTAPEQILRYKM